MRTTIPIEELSAAHHIVDNAEYTRLLTTDEANTLNDDIAANAMKQDDLEQEMSGYREEWKGRKKEIGSEKRALLRARRTGQKEETGRVFEFYHHETRQVAVYSAQGFLVRTRPMRTEEYQLAIDQQPGNVIPMRAAGGE